MGFQPGEELRCGIVGTGAIAHLHARAYRHIGFTLRACTDTDAERGKRFAVQHNTEFLENLESLCSDPDLDYIDVCTLPNFRLEVVRLCAKYRKHVQVQKPIATNLETAQEMISTARAAGITLGVVSQHRFDESSRFLFGAIRAGRLGRLLECDAYVKWHRTAEYYSRPGKGTWQTEGGGALINQAIHQIDLLRWLAGPVTQVFGTWQLGSVHKIESEDIVNAVLLYSSGATGVIQAATAFEPGYPERIELHGTKGTAIVTGDRLSVWDVKDDHGEPAPVSTAVSSGASDPMGISLEPFERQFIDFAAAIKDGTKPSSAGEEGYEALELVDAIYRSCRTRSRVDLNGP